MPNYEALAKRYFGYSDHFQPSNSIPLCNPVDDEVSIGRYDNGDGSCVVITTKALRLRCGDEERVLRFDQVCGLEVPVFARQQFKKAVHDERESRVFILELLDGRKVTVPIANMSGNSPDFTSTYQFFRRLVLFENNKRQKTSSGR